MKRMIAALLLLSTLLLLGCTQPDNGDAYDGDAYGCVIQITMSFWDGFNLYEEYEDTTHEYFIYEPGTVIPLNDDLEITAAQIDKYGITLKTNMPMSPGHGILLDSEMTEFTLYRTHTLYLATPQTDSGYSYDILLLKTEPVRLMDASSSP